MIAHIYDADGHMVKTTEGDEETILANIPPGGWHDETDAFRRPDGPSRPEATSPAP